MSSHMVGQLVHLQERIQTLESLPCYDNGLSIGLQTDERLLRTYFSPP